MTEINSSHIWPVRLIISATLTRNSIFVFLHGFPGCITSVKVQDLAGIGNMKWGETHIWCKRPFVESPDNSGPMFHCELIYRRFSVYSIIRRDIITLQKLHHVICTRSQRSGYENMLKFGAVRFWSDSTVGLCVVDSFWGQTFDEGSNPICPALSVWLSVMR